MKKGSALNCILFGMGILGILTILGGYKETFLSPGIYPIADTKGLLVGDYPEQKKPGVSNWGAAQAWPLYPVYEVGSYAQTTNNKRYWPTPCNGWSTPSEMCGGLYRKKKIDVPRVAAPAADCARVNFYCTTAR